MEVSQNNLNTKVSYEAAVKRKVQEEDDAERLAQLRKLEKQGQMVTSVDGDEAKAWANTIQSLPCDSPSMLRWIPCLIMPTCTSGERKSQMPAHSVVKGKP